MNNRILISNAKLLQKASAIKYGWLAMDDDGAWFWFSKRPRCKCGFWYHKSSCFTSNVKFLKLPKRTPNFAPHSLIKCTAQGPILLAVNKMYHKTWGMISTATASNLKKARR